MTAAIERNHQRFVTLRDLGAEEFDREAVRVLVVVSSDQNS